MCWQALKPSIRYADDSRGEWIGRARRALYVIPLLVHKAVLLGRFHVLFMLGSAQLTQSEIRELVEFVQVSASRRSS